MKRIILYSLLVLTGLSAIGASAAAAMIWWASRDLPSFTKLADYRLPLVTTVYARDGSIMGYFYKEKRFQVPIEQMPDHLRYAFIAAEDANFYEHAGIDPMAITRAFIRNLQAGRKTQGASTITQQIIKRLLLTDERTYIRKLKEAILAYRLERYLSKDEILTIYLNEIYLGSGAHGVEAAARAYFGKHVQELTLAESAVLASLPKAPTTNNPYRDPEATKGRQSYVLGQMQRHGWITQEERDAAYAQPLLYQSMPEPFENLGNWYREEVRRQLLEMFSEENVRAHNIPIELYGEDAVYTAGLHVYTAMDPIHQLAGETALRRSLLETTKRQGWRGPLERLSPEDFDAWLASHPFTPEALENAGWVKALVTEVTPSEATVRLGEYTGIISVKTMAWCREPNPRRAPDGIVIKDATKVLSPGNVVWVSAIGAKGTANPVGSPAKEPDAKDKNGVPAYDPATVTRQTPIQLSLEQKPDVEGALVSLAVPGGDVLALVGGYDFSYENQFNRATQARRQPGSSFKPVVYSAALDNGYTAASPLQDSPYVTMDGSGKMWRPSNYDSKFLGSMILRTALAKSRNLCTVQVAQRIGMETITRRARDLGIDDRIPNDLAVSLGAYDVSPLTMAQVYTAFANKGKRITPRFILSVTDTWGQTLVRNDPVEVQAISEQNAYIMATLLKEVVNAGTASRAKVLGRPVGGKTGTSNEEKDTWFIGISPYLVTSVYTGYDQVRSLGRLETGGRTALPAFIYYRRQVDELYPPEDFSPPETGITTARVDGKTGLLAGKNSADSYVLPFVKGTEPRAYGGASDVKTGEDLIQQQLSGFGWQ